MMRTFLQTFAAVAGLGLAAMLATNVAIDAYGAFRAVGLPTLDLPPMVWSRVSAAERLSGDCDVALLGSSRVVFGYDTAPVRWGPKVPCNGALGGSSMPELEAAFNLLLDQGEAKEALIFVDFHLFNPLRGYDADWSKSRFNKARDPLSYYAWLGTSYDTLLSDLQVLRGQQDWQEARMMAKGWRATRGQVTGFLKNPEVFATWGSHQPGIQALDRMLTRAEQEDVRVLVIVPPVHAIMLETIHHAGLWQANKAWRRDMTDVVYKHRHRAVQLWDFATYHAPAVANIPLKHGDPSHRYWADMSHMAPELGYRVAHRIRQVNSGKLEHAADAFGTVLTPTNIDRHLKRLDEGREIWRTGRQQTVRWFETLVEDVPPTGPATALRQAAAQPPPEAPPAP